MKESGNMSILVGVRDSIGWMCRSVLILLLLSPALPHLAVAAGTEAPVPSQATVTLVESGPGSIVLEFRAPDLTVQESVQAGTPCTLLSVPGLVPLSRAGRPVVPARGVLLAVPATDLRLEIVEATVQPLPAHALCLTPALQGTPLLSPATGHPAPEQGDLPEVYPGPLAEIGFQGSLRGQQVAQVQFYPLQVDSTHDRLLFYPYLRVRLAFDPAARTTRPARTAGGPFEPLLHNLLLNDPAPVASPSAPIGEGEDGRPADNSQALKVFVDEDGLVEITPDDLTAAGWDPSTLDPRTLKLSHQGVELPVWVEGQDDGSFDSGDFLLFYGQSMFTLSQGQPGGPYTRRNVYWLTTGGANGQRMAERDVDPVHGYPVPGSFAATLHAEVDIGLSGYWQNPPGREAQDHWYWTERLEAPSSAILPFQMPPFSTTLSMTLRVLLAGMTNDSWVSPDHHTRIALGGVQVHDAWWDGNVEYTHTVTLSPTLFVEGDNDLTVETVGDTGAAVDTLYANWLEVEYQALYASQGDELVFGAPAEGDYQFQISGFGSADIEAFDLSDPTAPVRLLGVESQPDGGSFTAVLEDHAEAAARYLALTPGQRRSPDGLVADQPSDLQNPANGADEIIITYDDFYTDTLALAAHRQAQGLRVQVARITDVYDEFSAGIFTPWAVRDFLAYAYQNWTAPAPTYVLLVGDANLDYLDRIGTGSLNYVPTYIFDAGGVGETAKDNWFVCVDGDDRLPDLFLGRFSARNSADVQAMVTKVLAYETSPPAGEWATKALFVADDDLSDFEKASEHWVGRLSPAYQPQRIYISDYPPGDPQSDIVSTINGGAYLVSYVGHGNQDRWGSWSGGLFFQTSTVGQLHNADRLPFMATATCLNGFFPNPLLGYSLAEELARKADGGAIGVWAPTALGWAKDHRILFGAMFEELFWVGQPTLGSITTQAKLAAYGQNIDRELLDTFVLFGDPALRLEVMTGYRAYLPTIVKGTSGD
jgi:hypothetical protein